MNSASILLHSVVLPSLVFVSVSSGSSLPVVGFLVTVTVQVYLAVSYWKLGSLPGVSMISNTNVPGFMNQTSAKFLVTAASSAVGCRVTV